MRRRRPGDCHRAGAGLATSIAIERVTAPTADASALIAELDAVLGALYEPHQRHGSPLAQLFEPHIRFFVARSESAAVGCGAVAMCDGYAEVKRMYTRPSSRGRGIAKGILGRLESEARGAAMPVLRLETGVHQSAAIGLYEACGFRPCEAFGAYTELPPSRIATSLFFEKRLAAGCERTGRRGS